MLSIIRTVRHACRLALVLTVLCLVGCQSQLPDGAAALGPALSATAIPVPTVTPEPSDTPRPLPSPQPTKAAAATGTPTPTEMPTLVPTRAPTATVSPTATPSIPALTLEGVFPPRDISALHLDPGRLRVLVATGDVIPARDTDGMIRRLGNNFMYPLAETKDILKAADVTVINLEAPLMQGCLPHTYGFTFCGQPGFAAALRSAGVDVVTLENNHIGNYGRQGVGETVQHLEANRMKWADRQTPAVVEVRGLKFGFLAFNGVGEWINRKAMVDQIKVLRPQVDVLSVAFHWGAEYVSVPETAPGIAPDDPTEIAHLAIDAGADLIIGNHPHWVQAVELYGGKYIAYAHGNFIFDQMWSRETTLGVIGRYTFYDRTLVKVEYIPVQIRNFAQPVPMEGPAAQAVLDGMKAASLQQAQKVASK